MENSTVPKVDTSEQETSQSDKNGHIPTRIDRGIRRGPRVRPKVRGKLALPPARLEDLPEIIRRYASGETMPDIAETYSVSKQAIYEWMLGGLGPKLHQDLGTKALVRRIAEADSNLEAASNALDLARARESARFARMDLERRRPALYGVKQEVAHTGIPPTLVINVAPQPLRVVEGESMLIPAQVKEGGPDTEE